ncbi:MAG TPA: hypothetical protein VE641_16315 [Chthoniobacterales bacterium]|nr:hypothetical protein [Chthoniobacterales bacterium]
MEALRAGVCQALGEGVVFHRADFHCKTPQRLQKFRDLAGIVYRRVERSTAVVIPLDEYDLLNQEFLFAEEIGYPFPFAARLCMGDVLSWAEHHSVLDPIVVVIEDGSKHHGQLKWICERDNLEQPILRDKKLVPLQAADLIASEIANQLNSFGPFNNPSCTGACLDLILRTLPKGWAVPDLRMVASILETEKRNPTMQYYYKGSTARRQPDTCR